MVQPLMDTNIKGLKELRWNIENLKGRIVIDASIELTRGAAQTIANAARKKVPKKSENLKKSITASRMYKNNKNWITYWVGHKTGKNVKNDGWYGRLVEGGTKGHLIPKESTKKYKKAAMKIAGSFVGGVVWHPGSVKKPYMEPAFSENWRKAITLGAKRAKKVIEKANLR